MEPQIQYAMTSDGVNIACYAIGGGPTVLFLIMPWSHLEAEWQIDSLRTAYTSTAQRFTLVRLDPRGFGLSDRDPNDFTVDRFVLDIEAVVKRLGLQEMSIYAIGIAAIIALAYAAKHPEQVTHLVQQPAISSSSDMTSERIAAIGELWRVDYELGSETVIRSFNPEFEDKLVTDFAGLLRAAIDPTSLTRLNEEMKQWDVSADAVSVSTPTLLTVASLIVCKLGQGLTLPITV